MYTRFMGAQRLSNLEPREFHLFLPLSSLVLSTFPAQILSVQPLLALRGSGALLQFTELPFRYRWNVVPYVVASTTSLSKLQDRKGVQPRFSRFRGWIWRQWEHFVATLRISRDLVAVVDISWHLDSARVQLDLPQNIREVERAMPVVATLEDHTPDIVIQASKALRVIAMTKQLWLKILNNLAFNGLLDLPPIDRLNISTDALILLVQRGVAGPASWLSSFPPNRPEQIVDLHLFGGGQYARICTVNSLKYITLAPATKFSQSHILWTMNTFSGRRSCWLADKHFVSFSFQLQAPLLQEVDLQTGQVKEVFSSVFTGTGFCREPGLLGELLVFSFMPNHLNQTVVVLIDWQRRKCLKLDYMSYPYTAKCEKNSDTITFCEHEYTRFHPEHIGTSPSGGTLELSWPSASFGRRPIQAKWGGNGGVPNSATPGIFGTPPNSATQHKFATDPISSGIKPSSRSQASSLLVEVEIYLAQAEGESQYSALTSEDKTKLPGCDGRKTAIFRHYL
ncbi:hypothetical protein R3P38DRAFT_2781522 [Favolaschia claudopus]|uniref:Uncharacterized protein n=1 Tax=Favolaschia claudopus TaxID=2862362 RepID=A0AAW0B493_9AGAR